MSYSFVRRIDMTFEVSWTCFPLPLLREAQAAVGYAVFRGGQIAAVQSVSQQAHDSHLMLRYPTSSVQIWGFSYVAFATVVTFCELQRRPYKI